MALNRQDLWSLEEYAVKRPSFREQVIAHKKNRQIALDPHATLYFEDAMTMQYQIQEMLRVERIFNPEEIEEELAAYNPLIPDGSNFKATFMIEYGDVDERKAALARMGGIEETVWVRVGDDEKIFAIANEDMDRSREDKAAAVHFLRFELPASAKANLLEESAVLSMGIDHEALPCEIAVEGASKESLQADLAP